MYLNLNTMSIQMKKLKELLFSPTISTQRYCSLLSAIHIVNFKERIHAKIIKINRDLNVLSLSSSFIFVPNKKLRSKFFSILTIDCIYDDDRKFNLLKCCICCLYIYNLESRW